jgi:hypothetical protein
MATYKRAKDEAAVSEGMMEIRTLFDYMAASARDQAICDWIDLIVLEQCRSRLSVHPYRRTHLKISLSHQIKIHGSQ